MSTLKAARTANSLTMNEAREWAYTRALSFGMDGDVPVGQPFVIEEESDEAIGLDTNPFDELELEPLPVKSVGSWGRVK